jgi:heme-degrading monooxygenase HmoA
MITFGLNYDVKEEYKDQFLQVSRDVLKAMPGMKGHVNTVLYSNVDSPLSFLIYSEWETNEDFKAFVTSQAFKDVQNMSKDMLTDRPKHQIYESRKMH